MKLLDRMNKKHDRTSSGRSRDELLKRIKSARRVLVEYRSELVEHELASQTTGCEELHAEIEALLESTSSAMVLEFSTSRLEEHYERVEALRARLEELATSMHEALETRKRGELVALVRECSADWGQLTLEAERKLVYGIRGLGHAGVTEIDGVSLESIERDFERVRMGPAMRRLHQEDMVDSVFRFEAAGSLDPDTLAAMTQFREAAVASEALVVNHHHQHPFRPAHMVKTNPQVFRVPLGIVPQLFGGSTEILALDGLSEGDIDTLLTLHGDDAYPTLVSARDAALALR